MLIYLRFIKYINIHRHPWHHVIYIYIIIYIIYHYSVYIYIHIQLHTTFIYHAHSLWYNFGSHFLHPGPGARVSIMADRAVVVAAGNAEKNVSAALYIFHRHEKRGWVPRCMQRWRILGGNLLRPRPSVCRNFWLFDSSNGSTSSIFWGGLRV